MNIFKILVVLVLTIGLAASTVAPMMRDPNAQEMSFSEAKKELQQTIVSKNPEAVRSFLHSIIGSRDLLFSNCTSDNGTIFHYILTVACNHNWDPTNILKIILDDAHATRTLDALINVQDVRGLTALFVALFGPCGNDDLFNVHATKLLLTVDSIDLSLQTNPGCSIANTIPQLVMLRMKDLCHPRYKDISSDIQTILTMLLNHKNIENAVNKQNTREETLLMMGVKLWTLKLKAAHIKAIRTILSIPKTDLTLQNQDHETALDKAQDNFHSSSYYNPPRNYEPVRLEIIRLIEARAHIDAYLTNTINDPKSNDTSEALLLASANDFVGIVKKLLLEHPNIDLTYADIDGNTALTLAKENQCLEIVNLLNFPPGSLKRFITEWLVKKENRQNLPNDIPAHLREQINTFEVDFSN